ncbi:unnamed protein product [Urochloa humidicola]
MEITRPIKKSTLGKRRTHKMKEPLEDAFCKRSKRLNKDSGGFRNQACQDAASDFPNIYVAVAAEASTPPALHLTADLVEGIGVEFLKMPPGAASAVALEELDD